MIRNLRWEVRNGNVDNEVGSEKESNLSPLSEATLRSHIQLLTSKKGFTLIEVLVVISIIGLITGAMLVALGGARTSGRDARRKADLEDIKGALELYRADCKQYPSTITLGSALTGASPCPTPYATYKTTLPNDPQASSYVYSYTASGSPPSSYALCARVENSGTSVSGCGSCGGAVCNYKVTSP